MYWWLIVAVLVIVAILFFKYKDMRHKIGLVTVILILLFLIVTFGQIYMNNSVDLTTFDGVVHAGQLYFSWLGNAFGNIVKIGGYVINQDWSATNSTITQATSKVK